MAYRIARGCDEDCALTLLPTTRVQSTARPDPPAFTLRCIPKTIAIGFSIPI